MGDTSTDRTPGDEASLHALYAAVPGAEEVDLAEEAPRRGHDVTEPLLFNGLGEPPPSADTDADREDDDDDDEPTPLTDGQARGVLEQLLGAEPVEDDADEES